MKKIVRELHGDIIRHKTEGNRFMGKITVIGLGLAKSVFQIHAITEAGHVAVQRALTITGIESFVTSNRAWWVLKLAGVPTTEPVRWANWATQCG